MREGGALWAVVLGLGASRSARAERERWAEVLLVWADSLGWAGWVAGFRSGWGFLFSFPLFFLKQHSILFEFKFKI